MISNEYIKKQIRSDFLHVNRNIALHLETRPSKFDLLHFVVQHGQALGAAQHERIEFRLATSSLDLINSTLINILQVVRARQIYTIGLNCRVPFQSLP